MVRRVEISRRLAIDLRRESFILYIDGREQGELGYEKASDFAAAPHQVLRSDEFKDRLSMPLQSLSPRPTVRPDRE